VVAALFDAGAQLRAALDAALAGDPSGVRPARSAEREALGVALAAANRILDEAGHPTSDAVRRRMEATLRAAMVDESVAEDLSQGMLDSDHDAPGFGFDGSAPVARQDAGPAGGAAAAATEATATAGAAREAAAREAAEDEEAARQAAALRAHLVENAERLAHRADELELAARDAEAAAERARHGAEAARTEADEARRAVEQLGPGEEGH